MKGLVVLLLLSVAPVVSSDAFGAGATPALGPRVALGVDAKGSRRYVQLTDRAAGPSIRPQTLRATATDGRSY